MAITSNSIDDSMQNVKMLEMMIAEMSVAGEAERQRGEREAIDCRAHCNGKRHLHCEIDFLVRAENDRTVSPIDLNTLSTFVIDMVELDARSFSINWPLNWCDANKRK